MDDVARPAAEDGVELVLTCEREALVAPVLVARERVPVVPAPRPLRHVAGNRADVADLRCRDAGRRLRENRIVLADDVVPAQGIQCDLTTDGHTRRRLRHLVQIRHRLEIDDDVGLDNAVLHQLKHVGAATCEDGVLPRGARLLGAASRVLRRSGVRVRKSLHASAPRILSRVMGRSLMRRPIAL